jgi:hypothetical protein
VFFCSIIIFLLLIPLPAFRRAAALMEKTFKGGARRGFSSHSSTPNLAAMVASPSDVDSLCRSSSSDTALHNAKGAGDGGGAPRAALAVGQRLPLHASAGGAAASGLGRTDAAPGGDACAAAAGGSGSRRVPADADFGSFISLGSSSL